MLLAEIPLVFVLVGLIAYALLAGADFGAGFWALLAGTGARGEAVREQTHRSLAPVWEANHVWVVFVLVVSWTAYPVAFASIASTLAIPLFLGAIGILFRGAAYAFRAQDVAPGPHRLAERVFGLSSIVTPFAFGSVIGAIAAGRVPVGNARGAILSSWLNGTSIFVGTLAVAAAAYLAAVYLAADAHRVGDRELERRFRVRALAAGAVAGLAAVGGLVVVHADVPRLWHGLSHGAGLAAIGVSGMAGAATIALVWYRRFDPARATAGVAVAAVVAGWALAQRPELLPGLTVKEAAAGGSTLTAVVIAVVIGSALLVPSFGLLFGLVLRGRFDVKDAKPVGLPVALASERATVSHRTAFAGALALAGAALVVVGPEPWLIGIGVAALVGAGCAAFPLIAAPPES